MNAKIKKIKAIAEKLLKDPAHDIEHVMRVYNISKTIALGEKIDHEVLEAAILLHDIGGEKELKDSTGNTDHAIVSAQMAKNILKRLNFSDDKIKHIQECIVSHRYKTENKPKTLEAKILFDADKLDSIGAIGVARSFAWVGKNNAKIFKKVVDVEEYAKNNLSGKINGRIQVKNEHSPQIEYEVKLKHLPDKLYTKKAKILARERLRFLKFFLDRLEKEIQGKI